MTLKATAETEETLTLGVQGSVVRNDPCSEGLLPTIHFMQPGIILPDD